MVSKSFKKCDISNAMDGTEDDLIWEENNENNNNDDEIEVVNLVDELADEDPRILVDESCWRATRGVMLIHARCLFMVGYGNRITEREYYLNS
ncbi:hypothetical protein Glove_165g89 [Diversispora epigaea]|uniref:Uncharacterized protein n=1 Tax=Diversispora epigaea TaxID=1348612 RepID=A0A397ITM9_9GLOM|nr:hypothetical protein Glove_165g89 [Diversispora epigaea]